MNKIHNNLSVELYPVEKQGSGAFDGGRITETKPIGFPGEGSVVLRIGPLFYWAWASSESGGLIALHPHQAFEIMSYAIGGEISHMDTLGTKSSVQAGGVQVMQTGSGVSHEEELGSETDMFQIWFEPHLKEALLRPPTYNQFSREDFPVLERDGVTVKSVIGGAAPMKLVADALVYDVRIDSGSEWRHDLRAGRSLASVAMSGSGTWSTNSDEPEIRMDPKDFVVANATGDSTTAVVASADGALHILAVEVPREVDYPLYAKN